MEEKENAVKVHAIRFSFLWLLLGLLAWSNPAFSWNDPQPQPYPQTQAEDDLDNKDLDDTDDKGEAPSEEAAPSDGGATPEAGAPEAAPKAKPAKPAPPVVPPTKQPVPGGTAKNPAARTPTIAPGSAPVPRPTLVKAPKTILGVYKADTGYSQASLVWELRSIWIVAGLLTLSFALLLLHFLLPVGGLRFLGKSSHFLLSLGGVGLTFLVLYRIFLIGSSPGSSLQTGLIWFSFVGIATYVYQRRAFSNVYLGSGILLVVTTAALGWSAINGTLVPELMSQARYSSLTWSLSSLSMYTAFGFLTVAGSWMVSSWFLGILAKRERGTGYGLEPATWEEYRLHPSFMVFLAYPLLTISWVLQLFWSQAHLGNATEVWSLHPRLWSVLVVWLLLSAHLFALRAPVPKNEFDDLRDEDASVSKSYPKLPGFLLLLATVGGSVLFVGIHIFLTYLRSS